MQNIRQAKWQWTLSEIYQWNRKQTKKYHWFCTQNNTEFMNFNVHRFISIKKKPDTLEKLNINKSFISCKRAFKSLLRDRIFGGKDLFKSSRTGSKKYKRIWNILGWSNYHWNRNKPVKKVWKRLVDRQRMAFCV